MVLNLTESKQTSTINGFFSFLIVKFYTYHENIIYIPKELDIYMETPNFFKDYISKFGILNANIQIKISLENKPNKPPLDIPDDVIEKLEEKIFIYEKLNIDIIINIIDNFDKKDKNNFKEEVKNLYKFTKEEFNSNKNNNKLYCYMIYLKKE